MFDKLNHKDNTELRQKKQQQQEYHLVGSMKHRAGHILYSINRVTGLVKQAEYRKRNDITWAEAVRIVNGCTISRDVIVEKNCVYLEALNAANAIKRYKKLYS